MDEMDIPTTASSDRVDEEKRNVRVKAFLYAASREDDNDYHLIIGRAPNKPAKYMTAEISGLPPGGSASFGKLDAARSAYFEYFGDGLPGTSYDFYDPPREIEIEGSLFWDASHASGGRPGPQKTASSHAGGVGNPPGHGDRIRAIEHDPEKWEPVFPATNAKRFARRSAQTKEP